MSLALKKSREYAPTEELGVLPFRVTQEILRAIQNIKYGSVEITVHDSRVVQIERKEKFRFQPEYEI